MDVDSELQTPPAPPKLCEALWFPDGNVVLATDSLLFKVHKGVLSLQSSVFKDMFELASSSVPEGSHLGQSTDAAESEMYEGLPLVKLVGDEGEDLVHLLQAAYERHYYRPDKDDSSLKTVVALLILSTKYDFKQIRKDVISHLSRHYPMNLKDYEEVDENDILAFGGLPRNRYHLKLLKAAFTADVDVVLPPLYYASADYAMSDLLQEADSLGKQCLDTLLKGREQLEHAMVNLIVKIPEKFFDASGISACSGGHGGPCLNEKRVRGLDSLTDTTGLARLTGRSVVLGCIGPICDPCRVLAESILDNERKAIWDNVPSFFGFPGWDVLRTKMEEFS